MILHRQGDVTAEQFQGIKFTVFVKRISGAPPETDNASQTAPGFERREALEELGSDVAVRTQKN